MTIGVDPCALRVGIGGPVGSGKTRLVEVLLPRLARAGVDTAVITNDLVTDEDARRVRASGLIAPERVLAVETGACPHTAIREDPSANLTAAQALQRRYPGLELVLIESGGDNLAATFTSDLVDFWIFVIDCAAGDDIPRKRGLGILQADLLVVNKIDLAPLVGADLDRMRSDADGARPDRPTVFTDLRSGAGVDELFATLVHRAQLPVAEQV
ncbi:MAG: urease accessory protein UreG [Actinomycetota bacterium]|nr:urease accessory protein UreG [Actinomycetota bacterium]